MVDESSRWAIWATRLSALNGQQMSSEMYHGEGRKVIRSGMEKRNLILGDFFLATVVRYIFLQCMHGIVFVDVNVDYKEKVATYGERLQ